MTVAALSDHWTFTTGPAPVVKIIPPFDPTALVVGITASLGFIALVSVAVLSYKKVKAHLHAKEEARLAAQRIPEFEVGFPIVEDVQASNFLFEAAVRTPGHVYYAVMPFGETPGTAFKLKVMVNETKFKPAVYVACGRLEALPDLDDDDPDVFGGAEQLVSMRVEGLRERTQYEVYAMTTNPDDDRCSVLAHVGTVVTGKTALPKLSKRRFEESWFRSSLMAMLQNRVEELSMVFKGLDDDKASAVAAYLKDNESVRVLSLHRNDIGDDGAVAIADALIYNRHLQKLFLNYNNIGERGLSALARALTQNESLSLICLTHNADFSDTVREAFDLAARNKDPHRFVAML